jgi:hypothetical protein
MSSVILFVAVFILYMGVFWGKSIISNVKNLFPSRVNKRFELIEDDSYFEEAEETLEIEDLNPKSNSKLNENDYRIVAKSLNPNMKLEDVVKVIFIKNPSEIGNIYSGQEENYSKHLLEQNKKCFEQKDGKNYFSSKDTIRLIPSYKK